MTVDERRAPVEKVSVPVETELLLSVVVPVFDQEAAIAASIVTIREAVAHARSSARTTSERRSSASRRGARATAWSRARRWPMAVRSAPRGASGRKTGSCRR